MHRHLQRQLNKLALSADSVPDLATWRALLERISHTYDDTDRDRYTLERSISLSSSEMQSLYSRLADERDRFRAIFEFAQVGMWRIELDGRIADANPAIERLLGYARAEMTGRFAWEFVDEREADGWRSYYALPPEQRRDVVGADRHYLRKDAAIVSSTTSVSLVRQEDGRPSFSIHVVEDVTERRRLEVELRQAQKLESVGRLAAGVAHEINTPIQFVGDSVQFIRDAVSDVTNLIPRYRDLVRGAAAVTEQSHGERLARELAVIEEEADLQYLLDNLPKALERSIDGLNRVTGIVRSMKVYAHPDGDEMTWVDLNRAIESTLTVARSEYKHVADVETDLGNIPLVCCQAGEVNQVLLNMIVNAAHAIEDAVAGTTRRGVIAVRTAGEGESVLVTISDTGGGIPEAIHGRIFDPFFTTKAVGRGTGQGLAIARSVVVDKHGGQITFDSAKGRGTTFYIRLPIDGERARLVSNAP